MVIFLFLRNVRATAIPSLALPMSHRGHVRGHVPARVQPRQPVADGAHPGGRVRGGRRDRGAGEHRPPHREGRAGAGRRRSTGSREITFTVDLDDALAGRGVHPGALPRRAHRPAVPGVRGHHRRGDPGLGLRLAHPHADAVQPVAQAAHRVGAARPVLPRDRARLGSPRSAGTSAASAGSWTTGGLAMAFSALILVGTVALFHVVPKGFIPSEDTGQLQATTETAEGTSYDAMVQHQRAAAAIVQEDPNVDGFMSAVGGGGPDQHGEPGPPHHPPQGPRDERQMSADEVAQVALAEAGRRARDAGLHPEPAGAQHRRAVVQEPVPVHPHQLRPRGAVRRRRRAGAADAGDSRPHRTSPAISRSRTRRCSVAIARDRASALGIDVNQIESALYNAYGARQVSTIYTPNDQYWVVMELLPEYQRDLSALNLLHITGRQGVSVPLGSLAKVTPGHRPAHGEPLGPAPLGHALVQPRSRARRSAPRSSGWRRRRARCCRPPSAPASPARRRPSSRPRPASLVLLVLAILVIYLVLGILYESFIHPLTILSGLPFAGLRRAAGAGGLRATISASTPSSASSCWSAS